MFNELMKVKTFNMLFEKIKIYYIFKNEKVEPTS